MSPNKPHRNYAGYKAERRNPFSGGYTIVLDCKLAEQRGTPIVEDYVLEGGRYQLLCDEHGHLVYVDSLRVAGLEMRDSTGFCLVCRAIAGEAGEDWERTLGLTDDDIAVVKMRQSLITKRPSAG